MTLPSDESTMLATQPQTLENDSSSETQRLSKSDWWFVRSVNQSAAESTGEAQANDPSTSTPADVGRKTLHPVRKDAGTISLDGNRKVLLQQWECFVLERKGDVVCCELHDLTNPANPSEYAEVLLDEFNDYDLPLLNEGAVFYWSLGHSRRSTGQVRRFSEFQVRRMPKLSRAQQREISRKVSDLGGLLLGK